MYKLYDVSVPPLSPHFATNIYCLDSVPIIGLVLTKINGLARVYQLIAFGLLLFREELMLRPNFYRNIGKN